MRVIVWSQPGYETLFGTAEGQQHARLSENGGYENLRVATVRFAMVDALRNPAPGFADVIRAHFQLKRRHICTTLLTWLQEGVQCKSVAHVNLLRQAVRALLEQFLVQFGAVSCPAEAALAARAEFTTTHAAAVLAAYPEPLHKRTC